MFQKYEIIIFENDSTDDTLKILNRYAEKFPLTIISEIGLDRLFVKRTQRLSYGRNCVLEEIKKREPDYHCIADMDGVLGSEVNIDSFLSNFSVPEAWDAVFPVNERLYYDIWALRHKTIYPYDYLREVENFHPQFNTQDALNVNLRSIAALDYQNLLGWLRVQSAFGGMGVYKTRSFKNVSYFGVNDGNEICEHVILHQTANKVGGQLFINPNFKLNSILG